MRNLHQLDRFRVANREVIKRYGSAGDHECGLFSIPSPVDRRELKVIASSGEGWDHVSVSRATRCPIWREMEFIKRLFFADDEVAMQLHVTPKNHISIHPYCLHLWRPLAVSIPLPPHWMVG